MSKLTVSIPDDLHQKIREELEKQGITTSQFIEQAVTNFFENPKGEINMATRTLAFQVSEELFQRVKAYLARYEEIYHRKLSQKEFVIGLIEAELDEADEEFAVAEAAAATENLEVEPAAEEPETDDPADEDTPATDEDALDENDAEQTEDDFEQAEADEEEAAEDTEDPDQPEETEDSEPDSEEAEESEDATDQQEVDVLTGVSKKNTGQLPQYYIENNHAGIVTKQMFREVQAEIARRNSKDSANKRKRHRGRYNSKYALSERLVCGNCGSPYKRVTWNIHGRKQIVWRCVNRLEYGTKFCGNSPSIPETELHQAIMMAIRNLARNFTDEVAAQLNGILRKIEAGENSAPQLQAELERTQQEFDHLLEMSLDFDEETPFLDDRLKKLSNKIKQLKTEITKEQSTNQEPLNPTDYLTAADLLITEYDDILTARIIEKVIVKSRQNLEVVFIGGYTQQVSLQ